jgi:hypothetical protein
MITLLFLLHVASTVTIIVSDKCIAPTDAKYFIATKTVAICQTDQQLQEEAVVHELWHHFYFNILTATEHAKWDRAFAACNKPQCFISKEAQQDAIEDFARTFERMHAGVTCRSKPCQTKIAFIERVIERSMKAWWATKE